MGWLTSSTQMLSKNTYAPLFLQADIPEGAYLNWTLLDASGQVIPGMMGTNSQVIPLGALDHLTYSQFRIFLEFSGSTNGMPTLYSISGDGSIEEDLYTHPEQRGWTLNGSQYSSVSQKITGNATAELISPWYLSHMPLYGGQVSGISSNALIQVRTDPSTPWHNISFPHSHNVSGQVSGVQYRISALPPTDGNMSNFTQWEFDELRHTFYGGVQPSLRAHDLGEDGR